MSKDFFFVQKNTDRGYAGIFIDKTEYELNILYVPLNISLKSLSSLFIRNS